MASGQQPRVVVIGGPNGAGKTTSAATLLPNGLFVLEFVNADGIAAGLSAFSPEKVAINAGRVMLARLSELARARSSFAFETTLASRSFVPFLRGLKEDGYLVHLIYIWLDSAELAIDRVAARVQRGGHHVPDEVVRRRYLRGLRNFRTLYRPLANSWIVCDNSGERLKLIARGVGKSVSEILDEERYREFERS
jgi:predicted ABC-type ATPase